MASLFKNIATYFKPVLKDSQLYSTGCLTPEEFVQAGDTLTTNFGTWQWNKGAADRAASYLPADKQFLISRNVPCTSRVLDFFRNSTETDFSSGGGDEDWTVANMNGIGESASTNPNAGPANDGVEDDDDDDSIPDLDDFGLGEDEDVDESAAPAPVPENNTSASNDSSSSGTRTYDISIVYDKFYRTPCVYLTGRDEFGGALSVAQIWEDVSSDHRNKTITQGVHPHTGVPHLYIHPCKHSVTMKSMISMLEDEQRDLVATEQAAARKKYDEQMKKYREDLAVFQDESRVVKPIEPIFTEEDTEAQVMESLAKALPVDQYLMLFLKFINTIIPTMQYDFTMSSL